MHGVLDIPCFTKHNYSWKRLVVIWGSFHDWSISFNCQQELSCEKVAEKENFSWIFCWETPRMKKSVSWERKRLLNVVSQKLISYDFCASFVLYKVKWAFWRFQVEAHELTHVRRYLAYVTNWCSGAVQYSLIGVHVHSQAFRRCSILTHRHPASSNNWRPNRYVFKYAKHTKAL